MKFESLTVKESSDQTLITLDETKAQLRVLDQYDDVKIKSCAESAVSYCENFLWRSFRPQTVVASYSPDGRNFAELFRGAFNSLISVKYFDEQGEIQELPAGNISVDESLFVPRAYFAEPQTKDGMFGAIKIEYSTRAALAVAPQIKQAALIAAAQFYDDRDAPDLSAVDKILSPLAVRYFL